MEKMNIAQIEGQVLQVEKNGIMAAGIIGVERTSGVIDKVPFRTLDLDIQQGDWVKFSGHIRTANVRDQFGKSHKKMFVWGRKDDSSYACRNEIEFNGTLVHKDKLRQTPKGKTILDAVIAVNEEDGKSYYPAIILWGTPAEMVNNLPIGTKLHIQGRFQSREYKKVFQDGEEIRTAYEVSVRSIECL